LAVDASDELTEREEATWTVVSEGFDPLNERGAEAVFAVANGHFGVRASLEEGNPASNPMVIVAGVYTPTSLPAGQTLLTLRDPSTLFVRADGVDFNMSTVRTTSHLRRLDLPEGILRRIWLFGDRHGHVWRWESFRAASATRPDIYLYQLALTLESSDGPMDVTITIPNASPSQAHPRMQDQPRVSGVAAGRVETEIFLDGKPAELQNQSVSVAARQGEPIILQMIGRIVPEAAPQPSKEKASFQELVDEHRDEWKRRWQIADLKIDGDDRLQQAIRFSTYHLLSSASVNEGRSSIGPRDLSGVAYHGHIFWDTELFILPFLTLTWPESARSCLLYRYRTLQAARRRAKSFGYEGAMYAWESTDTGEDKTPEFVSLPDGSAVRVLNGEQENHISGAVPYAAVHYWHATGDDDFMTRYGAEILIECARFWRSRVSPSNHGYAIRNVIGPDEYHDNVNNNAYTNALARWVLLQADSYLTGLRESNPEDADELIKRLKVQHDEPSEWRQVAELMLHSTFLKDEVIEQFDGFFGYEAVDVASYLRAGVPLDIAVGHDEVQHMRAVKQADVLMALRLFPEWWTEKAARKNVDYYEPMTAHTSSLSPSMHALLAAWLRDETLCRKYLNLSMSIDLQPPFRGAAGGVRIASQGALRQAIVFGFAGLKFNSNGLGFDPFLPAGIDKIEYTFLWQHRKVEVRFNRDNLFEIRIEGPSCPVRVNKEERLIESGAWQSFSFDPSITFWSAIDRKGDSGAFG
jgi:trehalose/maltose hydrolase-like predicted phosphorylase